MASYNQQSKTILSPNKWCLLGTCKSAICIRIESRIESGIKIRIRVESRIESAVGPTIVISERKNNRWWAMDANAKQIVSSTLCHGRDGPRMPLWQTLASLCGVEVTARSRYIVSRRCPTSAPRWSTYEKRVQSCTMSNGQARPIRLENFQIGPSLSNRIGQPIRIESRSFAGP